MVRVTKSIKINPDLWRGVKVYCAKKGIEISEFIEGLINKGLKQK